MQKLENPMKVMGLFFHVPFMPHGIPETVESELHYRPG